MILLFEAEHQYFNITIFVQSNPLQTKVEALGMSAHPDKQVNSGENLAAANQGQSIVVAAAAEQYGEPEVFDDQDYQQEEIHHKGSKVSEELSQVQQLLHEVQKRKHSVSLKEEALNERGQIDVDLAQLSCELVQQQMDLISRKMQLEAQVSQKKELQFEQETQHQVTKQVQLQKVEEVITKEKEQQLEVTKQTEVTRQIVMETQVQNPAPVEPKQQNSSRLQKIEEEIKQKVESAENVVKQNLKKEEEHVKEIVHKEQAKHESKQQEEDIRQKNKEQGLSSQAVTEAQSQQFQQRIQEEMERVKREDQEQIQLERQIKKEDRAEEKQLDKQAQLANQLIEKQVEVQAPIFFQSSIYYSSYFQWKTGFAKIQGNIVKLPEKHLSLGEITKVKALKEQAINNSRKIKISNFTHTTFFSAQPKATVLDLPLHYIWFAKIISSKLKDSNWDFSEPFVPEQTYKNVNIKDAQIEGVIYKKSQFRNKWELRYVAITSQGLFSFKEEEGSESFSIRKDTATQLWTRFETYEKMLVVKVRHGAKKTEFAIPIKDFFEAGNSNWMYGLYSLVYGQ